jgi:hypothetical protein
MRAMLPSQSERTPFEPIAIDESHKHLRLVPGTDCVFEPIEEDEELDFEISVTLEDESNAVQGPSEPSA